MGGSVLPLELQLPSHRLCAQLAAHGMQVHTVLLSMRSTCVPVKAIGQLIAEALGRVRSSWCCQGCFTHRPTIGFVTLTQQKCHAHRLDACRRVGRTPLSFCLRS